ncbi:MAG TPA: helix-turn-helix domain-containing protein [Bacilli bacterium]|jgi:transcriptional regulator with XRE-family HTH domain|nr:helix-turn-helix domain-containing protein [Bacilli bacterium]
MITNLTSINEVQKELGARIHNRRINMSLTQKDLAERSGLSLRSINNIEQGKETNFSSILRVLLAFNLLNNVEYLLPDELPSPLLINEDKRYPQRVRKKRKINGEWKWEE